MNSAILIVDDNKEAADSMKKLLAHIGFDVSVVYSGKEALAIIPAKIPRVVLLDIRMPELDGYAVAEKIRANSKYAKTILIALTGFGQEEDKLRSDQAGFNHHLTKPASINELKKILDLYIKLKK